MKARIKELHINARKTKNKPAQEAYEAVLVAIQAKEIESRIELTDGEIIAVAQKVLKQLKESLEYATTDGNKELVDRIHDNINCVNSLLPQTYTDVEVVILIKFVIDRNSIPLEKKNMGSIVKLTVVASEGRTDSATVARLVKVMLDGN